MTTDRKEVRKGVNQNVEQEARNKGGGFQEQKKKNRERIEFPEKTLLKVQNKFDKLEKTDGKELGEGDVVKETTKTQPENNDFTPKIDTRSG